VVIGFLLSHFMPYVPGLRNLILGAHTADRKEPQLSPALAGEPSPTALIEQDASLLNQHGVAYSTLRPSGKARINGRLVDVVSDVGFIDPGTEVKVVSVAGNRVVVRPAG